MDTELWHWGLKRLKTKSGKNPSNFNASFAIKNLLDDHICIILQQHFRHTNVKEEFSSSVKPPFFSKSLIRNPKRVVEAPSQNDNMRWSTFLSKLPSHGNYQHSRWKRNLTRPRSFFSRVVHEIVILVPVWLCYEFLAFLFFRSLFMKIFLHFYTFVNHSNAFLVFYWTHFDPLEPHFDPFSQILGLIPTLIFRWNEKRGSHYFKVLQD